MFTTLFSSTQINVAVSSETAWQKMKQYGNLSWAEGIDDVKLVTDGVSQCRKILLSGSDEWFDEWLLSFDERGMTLRYAIDDNAMGGLTGYEAQAQVLNRADGCTIRWQCQATATNDKQTEVQALLDMIATSITGLFAAQFNTDSEKPENVSA